MAKFDIIKDKLYAQVNRYRYRDLETSLIADVSIIRHPKARKTTFGHNRRVGYTRYHVEAWGESSIELVVFFAQTSNGTIHDTTQETLRAYLDTLARPINPLDDHTICRPLRQLRANNALQAWWDGNDKSFQILNLPAELRNAVYAAVFPSTIRPFERYRMNKREPPLCVSSYDSCLNLMMASQQLSTEALKHCFTYTIFSIENLVTWRRVTNNLALLMNVRHLKFSLHMPEFLKLFGTSVRCSNKHSPGQHIQQLRNMTLHSLAIHIPDLKPYRSLPWAAGACRKKFLDFCLELIWPYIKGHRNISISGNFGDDCQLSDFKEACLAIRTVYERWLRFAAAHQRLGLTLVDFDDWEGFEDDGDGGVPLVNRYGSEDDRYHLDNANYNGSVTLAESLHCNCEPACI